MSIKNIAKLAGVSVSTVSRVINNHPYVTEEKREKVLSIMAEINYIPNKNAINLSNGQSDVIGVVIPFTRNSCYDQLLESILYEATKNKKKVLLLPTYFNNDLEKEYYTLLRDKTVDGIIVSSRTHDDKFLKELNQFGSIVTTESTDVKEIISVYPDRLSVYHSIFSYILSLDQYKTVLITVNRSKKKSFSTKTKMAVFSEYFPSISISDSFVERISTYEDGYQLGKKIFKSAIKPIIYCNGDDVAAGLYQAAIDLNLKNKIDFYLIGEDNQFSSKLLSIDTVDFKLDEVGKQAVISLLNKTKTSIAIEAEFKKRGVNE